LVYIWWGGGGKTIFDCQALPTFMKPLIKLATVRQHPTLFLFVSIGQSRPNVGESAGDGCAILRAGNNAGDHR